jgi:hypothetical protein
LDFTTDNLVNAKWGGYSSRPFESFASSQKNRGGRPPLFMLDVSTGNYESAIAAIETDTAVSQANAKWNWVSELSVLTSEA